MKICSICKTLNDDSSNFCQRCGGSSFEQQNQQAPQNPQNENFFQQNDFQTPQYGEPSVNPAISVIRNMGSGSLFFAAVILFTLTTAFGLISGLANSTGGSTELLNEYMSRYGINNFGKLATYFSSYTLTASLIGSIPNILICVGLWKLRNACKNNTSNGIDTNGLNILRISVIIEFVALCVVFVFVEVLLIYIMSNLSEFGKHILDDVSFSSSFGRQYDISEVSKAATGGAIVGVTLAIGGAITLFSFYYIKILKTIKTIKNTAITGVASDKISMFVIVMNYIFAFGLISGAFKSGIGFISNGSNIAFYIIISILLYKYRNEMRTVMFRNQYNFSAGGGFQSSSGGIN